MTVPIHACRLKKMDMCNDTNPVNFLPVRLKSASQNRLTLKLNGRHSIELDKDFDGDLLARVIQVIEQVA